MLRLEAEEKEVKLQTNRIYFEEKLIVELVKNFVRRVVETGVRVRPLEEEVGVVGEKELSEITLKQDSSREKCVYLEMFSSNFLMTL